MTRQTPAAPIGEMDLHLFNEGSHLRLWEKLGALGLLGVMFYTDWRLSLICLIVLPVFALSVSKVGARLRRLSRNNQEAMRNVSEVVEEAARNQRVVRSEERRGGKECRR